MVDHHCIYSWMLLLKCCRSAFILADQERQGGISPHISPFMNVPDAGNLLVSSGFQLCTGSLLGVGSLKQMSEPPS